MQRASDIRIERLRLGVSGYEVAKALRVSPQLVYFWETGQRKLRPETREKIRKYLLTRSTLGA